MLSLNDEQKQVWVAGLFDGEGNFTVAESCGFTLQAIISNNYIPLLEEIKFQIGFGLVIKTCPRWICQSKKDVTKFLDLVEPFLIVKRHEAEMVRLLLSTVNRGKHLSNHDALLRYKIMEVFSVRSAHAIATRRECVNGATTTSPVGKV